MRDRTPDVELQQQCTWATVLQKQLLNSQSSRQLARKSLSLGVHLFIHHGLKERPTSPFLEVLLFCSACFWPTPLVTILPDKLHMHNSEAQLDNHLSTSRFHAFTGLQRSASMLLMLLDP